MRNSAKSGTAHRDITDAVLIRLEEGENLSGSALARELGVSRTAVWKAVKKLEFRGCQIETSRKGYLLRESADLIHPNVLSASLKELKTFNELLYLQKTDSTNLETKRQAESGAPEGLVVVAERQEQGRGRLGRDWSSPPGGIWFSLLMRPAAPPVEAGMLTLLASVAVHKTLSSRKIDCWIKWPNDLMVGEKKVCGILGEMSAEIDRVLYVALGIGLNANLSKEDLGAGLSSVATSLLMETGTPFDRTSLLYELIRIFEEDYLAMQARGPEEMLAYYRKHCGLWGGSVTVRTLSQEISGVARDINGQGELILETGDVLRTVTTGEVTLLRPRLP